MEEHGAQNKWPYQSVTGFFFQPCKWSCGITGKDTLGTWSDNLSHLLLKFSQLSSQCVTSESVWISIKKSLGSRTQKAVSVGFETIAVSTLEFCNFQQLKLLTLRTDINWSCREVFWRNSSQIKATIFHLPVVYLYIFYSSDNLRSIWSSKMLCNVQGQLILESLKKRKKKKTLRRYGVDRLSELLSCCTFRWHWLPCYWIYFLRR